MDEQKEDHFALGAKNQREMDLIVEEMANRDVKGLLICHKTTEDGHLLLASGDTFGNYLLTIQAAGHWLASLPTDIRDAITKLEGAYAKQFEEMRAAVSSETVQ